VYIVISGEMELTKTLVYKGIKSEKVENIFKDPIKANKKQNILFSKNILYKEKKMNVSFHNRTFIRSCLPMSRGLSLKSI
jgi:hypothetical protein